MHPLAYLRRALSVASAAILIASGAFALSVDSFTVSPGSSVQNYPTDLTASATPTAGFLIEKYRFEYLDHSSNWVLVGESTSGSFQWPAPDINAPGETISYHVIAFEWDGVTESPTTAEAFAQNTVVNQAPILSVSASPNPVHSGQTATLTGTANDDHGIASVGWTAVNGGPAPFPSTSNVATFVAPGTPGDYVYRFTATDDDNNTQTKDVTVTVTNSAPVANDQTISTPKNTAKSFTLTSSDSDGDPRSYVVDSLPANGTLTGTAPSLTYTPNTGFVGTNTFTFHVNDGFTNSNTGTVTINVTSNPPQADPGSASTTEDAPVGITLHATDPDSDPLTYAIVSQPANGNVTFTSGDTVQYTPHANFNGTDEFFFKANDGTADSNNAKVTVTVSASPDGVSIQSVGVNPPSPISGHDVTLTGNATDPDGGAVTYDWSLIIGTSTTSLGTGNPKTFNAPSVAADTAAIIRLVASDNDPSTAQLDTPITIHPNSVPVAVAIASQTVVNELVPVDLYGTASTDADGDALSYQWTKLEGPDGTLSNATTSTATFTAPNIAATTIYKFQLKVKDNHGGENIAIATVTVQNVAANNHAPTVTISAPATVIAGTNVQLQAIVTDPDPFDTITYQWDQQAAPFTTIGNPNTANASFSAPAVSSRVSFTFRVTVGDGQGGIASDTVTVTVLDPAQAFNGVPLIADPKIFPSPFSPSEGGATIRYTLRNPADVTIVVSDIFGLKVREFRVNSGESGGTAGDNDVHWDGRNEGGDSVANGAYVVQIRASDGASSAKKTERVGVIR